MTKAMTIRLYNTLTKYKDIFDPIDPTNVRMYVCGPTVYDFAHIGNARPVVVFDVLFRLLRHAYGDNHVTYVRNITDIDDKINARALERRGNRDILTALRELTEDTQSVYLEDVAALGNLPPTYTPRATEHVAQQAEQHVEDDHRPRVADMREVVDGGSADVHAHVLGVDRREQLLLAHRSVVDRQGHHAILKDIRSGGPGLRISDV